MATAIHTEFRNANMGAPTHSVIDFDTDDIRLSLLDQDDSGVIDASDVDYADINAGTVVAEGTNLAAKTVGVVNPGVFDADHFTFVSVSGDAADYLTLYKWNATASIAPLAVTWDSATTGLPVTPNGGDIEVQFAGAGILQI